MFIDTLKLINFFEKLGFYFLSATLFLISYPRFISLYTFGLFIICGVALWILDFKGRIRYFITNWYILLPLVFFFLIQFLSLLLQKGSLALLESRFIFLLVPIFGFPVFRHLYLKKQQELLLKIFVLGMATVSLFLVIRLIYFILTRIPEDMTLGLYFQTNNQDLVSTGFSIMEHPSYISMKVLFAFILLLMFSKNEQYGKILILCTGFLFSVIIFLLASKAGIVAWLVIFLLYLIYTFRNIVMKLILYLLIIPLLFIFIYISSKTIVRLNYFIVYTERGISNENFDWKNLDQRTREWYSAIQIIKEKPLTGVGLARVDERRVQEYLKNGWEEEAALNLNAHNQFMEAQMTFGIAGSIALLWMLLTPLIFRKQLKYPKLAVWFVLMISFFLMFESMFNRQWGIMFFVLFYCILTLNKNEKINNDIVEHLSA